MWETGINGKQNNTSTTTKTTIIIIIIGIFSDYVNYNC